jgi:3-methylfumaryl-CoA hydratase
MTAIDLQYLQQWQGREETDRHLIDTRTVARMAGALGLDRAPGPGDALPMPWHWLFFTPIPHALETGEDGHPARGGFLPPVPLPRRMWAGSRVTCHQPLRVGESAQRSSRIDKVTAKTGRSGQLVFVTVEHQIYSETQELLIEESQDLVYREPASAAATANSPQQPYQSPVTAQWSESVMPDPVLLFRYSALTFNGHRIHYDRDYAVNEEGYPGLVVQGPLTASLLLNMMYRQLGCVTVKTFSFRGAKPLFDTDSFLLQGAIDQQSVKLWALTPDRQLAMSLDIELAQ